MSRPLSSARTPPVPPREDTPPSVTYLTYRRDPLIEVPLVKAGKESLIGIPPLPLHHASTSTSRGSAKPMTARSSRTTRPPTTSDPSSLTERFDALLKIGPDSIPPTTPITKRVIKLIEERDKQQLLLSPASQASLSPTATAMARRRRGRGVSPTHHASTRRDQCEEARNATLLARGDHVPHQVPAIVESQSARLHPSRFSDDSFIARDAAAMPAASARLPKPSSWQAYHEACFSGNLLKQSTQKSRVDPRITEDMNELITDAKEANKPKFLVWKGHTKQWLSRRNRHVARELSPALIHQLKNLFNILDDDGNETLDIDELQTALKVCGFRPGKGREVAAKMLQLAGKSLRESLTFAEFARLIVMVDAPPSGGPPGASKADEATSSLFQKFQLDSGSNTGNSFALNVLAFKRQRLFDHAKSHRLY